MSRQRKAPTAHYKDRIEGVVSEVEYRDENGVVVGYWAFGSFDPNLPYCPKDTDVTWTDVENAPNLGYLVK